MTPSEALTFIMATAQKAPVPMETHTACLEAMKIIQAELASKTPEPEEQKE